MREEKEPGDINDYSVSDLHHERAEHHRYNREFFEHASKLAENMGRDDLAYRYYNIASDHGVAEGAHEEAINHLMHEKMNTEYANKMRTAHKESKNTENHDHMDDEDHYHNDRMLDDGDHSKIIRQTKDHMYENFKPAPPPRRR